MNLLDMQGRVAIVTGAGRGIGRSHALMLAARGARVVVNDLPSDSGGSSAAEGVVREIRDAGGNGVADHHNVVDDADAVVRTAIDAFGCLDILINNAGVISTAPFSEDTETEWEAVFNTHLLGTSRVCRAAWPHLLQSGTGRVVNTSSSGMLGQEGITSYGAAKAAIFGLTRSLALEGERYGIRANAILPLALTRMAGVIQDTRISDTLRKSFQPDHISALVVWLCHQDTEVNNEAIQVGGGRAGRLVMAMYPSMSVINSTPEDWRSSHDQMWSDDRLTPLFTTADLFALNIAEVDPGMSDVALSMPQAAGGVALNSADVVK